MADHGASADRQIVGADGKVNQLALVIANGHADGLTMGDIMAGRPVDPRAAKYGSVSPMARYVRGGPTQAIGGDDPRMCQAIDRAFARHTLRIAEACYARAAESGPSPGRIAYRFAVVNGSPTEVHVHDDNTGNAQLTKCAMQAISAAALGQPRDDELRYEYAFVFAARPNSPPDP